MVMVEPTRPLKMLILCHFISLQTWQCRSQYQQFGSKLKINVPTTLGENNAYWHAECKMDPFPLYSFTHIIYGIDIGRTFKGVPLCLVRLTRHMESHRSNYRFPLRPTVNRVKQGRLRANLTALETDSIRFMRALALFARRICGNESHDYGF